LLKGAIGRAGHLGHVSIKENQMRSIFGMPGSLEAAIGNYTVNSRTAGRFNSTRELVQAHVAGDDQATLIWTQSIQDLARAIASFINCFDPEKVILGGGIAKAGPTLFGPLEKVMQEIEWRPGGRRVPIVPARLGEWAGTYGAAWNAFNCTHIQS
jgi:glucokinase